MQLDVQRFSDRRMVGVVLQAAARGARIRVLLDPSPDANLAVAGELVRGGTGRVDVRWRADSVPRAAARLTLIQHGRDSYLNLGSADLTRHDLGDLNLEANVELRLQAASAVARAAAARFEGRWARAAAYYAHTDESYATYWRYRLSEAIGLTNF